ncbi:hypothetical protein SDC9_182469 [bioreactor metagenome]|uniref:Uncharacterized protein n=1 Tax=bioreactor metagenome TaxID=1076179 RepID=A0A645H7J0_9ZZZZ
MAEDDRRPLREQIPQNAAADAGYHRGEEKLHKIIMQVDRLDPRVHRKERKSDRVEHDQQPLNPEKLRHCDHGGDGEHDNEDRLIIREKDRNAPVHHDVAQYAAAAGRGKCEYRYPEQIHAPLHRRMRAKQGEAHHADYLQHAETGYRRHLPSRAFRRPHRTSAWPSGPRSPFLYCHRRA